MTIISNNHTFQQRAVELEEWNTLWNKNTLNTYPGWHTKSKVIRQKQPYQRNESKKRRRHVIAYVSTFNQRNPEIFGEIRRDIDILKRDSEMRNVLNNCTIIKSKRQPPN
jgi:hypothetical protein